MGDVINLNRYRKERQRTAAGGRAAANRVRHGLTAAERARMAREKAEAKRLLDGKRLDAADDRPGDDGPKGRPEK